MSKQEFFPPISGNMKTSLFSVVSVLFAQKIWQCFFSCIKLGVHVELFITYANAAAIITWPRGPMDKAPDYESGDSRFESWRGQIFFLFFVLSTI